MMIVGSKSRFKEDSVISREEINETVDQVPNLLDSYNMSLKVPGVGRNKPQ